MKRKRLSWVVGALAFGVLCPGTTAVAQSTAFTFQGSLTDNGRPAAGLHDLRFRLFDAPSAGTQIGTVQCVDNLQVTEGWFTATLDFGDQFTTPDQRYLEIEVRRDTGLSCSNAGGFVVLSPRQPITATPRASHAENARHADSAFALDSADGSVAHVVFVDNIGRVGIGTTAPTHSLHIASTAPTIALQDADSSGQPGGSQVGYLSYRDSANLERAWIGYGTAGDPDLSIINARAGGDIVLNSLGSGRVGIGTSTPTAELHVIGTVLGTFGAFEGNSSTNFIGAVTGVNRATAGCGVVGKAGNTGTTNSIGVQGIQLNPNPDASSFGVFSSGRLGASGTKSFRIDHPEHPDTRYLFHYCTESPEVINFYRGNATLDDAGRAVVQLPSYFAKINSSPSYQLTPIGAPMPSLHISIEIDERALASGNEAAPGVAAPGCWFEIAGGAPGGRVSWRVEALRSDEFVRRNGAPVEVEKDPA